MLKKCVLKFYKLYVLLLFLKNFYKDVHDIILYIVITPSNYKTEHIYINYVISYN